MGFTDSAYKNFFIQEIDNLKNPIIPDLELNSVGKLVQEYFMRTIFHGDKTRIEMKPIVFYILRRTQSAIETYKLARESTLKLSKLNENKIGVYLTSINNWENLISYLAQIFELYKKVTKQNYFEKGSNCSKNRLNTCYNILKHIVPKSIPKGRLQHSHLENSGIVVNKTRISFHEIKTLIGEVYELSLVLARQDQNE